MFQPELTVTALDGMAAVFLPADDPLDPASQHPIGDDPEDRHLRLLYRDRLRFATGHNVAVRAETRPGQRRAWRLTTTWLPTYEVAQVAAAGAASGVPLGMDELAESPDPGGLAAALGGLVDEYDQLPGQADDFLHGAACHTCLFVSETTCERGNRFLDRRLVVPVTDPELALLRDLPQFAERLPVAISH